MEVETMSDVLSQSEIDALLHGIPRGEVDVENLGKKGQGLPLRTFDQVFQGTS